MSFKGVELEIRVPCANREEHPVRVRYTDWDAISCEVIYNPCQEKAHDSPDSPPPCIKMLQDKRISKLLPRKVHLPTYLWEKPTHRLALLRGLSEEKAPAAVQMLLKALEDPDPTVAFTAAELLGNFPNDPTISEALVEKIISILRTLYEFLRSGKWFGGRSVSELIEDAIPLGRRVLSELLLRRRRRPSFM
jgi:predicted CopG family antitoxin